MHWDLRIVYVVTAEEKSISTNVRFVTRAEGECYKHNRRNRRFPLVANDTFPKKGEKHELYSPSEGGNTCKHLFVNSAAKTLCSIFSIFMPYH